MCFVLQVEENLNAASEVGGPLLFNYGDCCADARSQCHAKYSRQAHGACHWGAAEKPAEAA